MKLDRRAFLAGTAAVAVAPAAGCADPEGLKRRVRRSKRVAKAYFEAGERRDVRDAAKRVLEVTGEEEAALAALFEPALGVIEMFDDEVFVLPALQQAMREEFANLDVVLVDGWVLAPTEAGLVAMLVF